MAKQRVAKKKMPFGITEEFTSMVDSSNTDQLKQMIVQIQGQLDETRTFLKMNEDIIHLKGQIDLIAGPSRETIKSLGNRTKHIVDALKDKGAL